MTFNVNRQKLILFLGVIFFNPTEANNVHGRILGERQLAHPHLNEQPFTRGLANIKIPENNTVLYIEAHDKLHGWSAQSLKIDLEKVAGGHLRVEMLPIK